MMRSINDIGYVTSDKLTGDIIFGKRNNRTITNTITSGYIFTARSYLSLRLRHYWSIADYDNNFYFLNSDGTLSSATYTKNPDNNFNTLNIDLVYTWRFAPGSEMTIVWKNSIFSSGGTIYKRFGENLSNMFDSPATNSLSLKVLYYLDYQNLRKKH
jgi:hypothetical protein